MLFRHCFAVVIMLSVASKRQQWSIIQALKRFQRRIEAERVDSHAKAGLTICDGI
jgi:hypothetical protein